MAAAGTAPGVQSVLHITDLHLLDSEEKRLLDTDTTGTLRSVLAAATRERQPAALLATGDIAHDPVVATYRRCLDILREFHGGPLLCLPGNHDLLQPMVDAGMPMEPLRLGPWRILPWDTHEDDGPGAVWRRADWEELLEAIETSGDHLVVATHHPLVDVGCPWLDKDRLRNAPELVECLAQATSVKSVVFGHAHQTVESRHGHMALLGTPSTCFQFEPRSLEFGLDGSAPGYRWLHLHDDGSLRTEVRRIKEIH